MGRLLRDTFGKGPESVYVSIGYTFITMYLRNFLTPSEKVLMEQDQEIIVMQTRDKLMQTLMPELNGYLEGLLGQKPGEVYYDWGLHNRAGMIVGVFSGPVEAGERINEAYAGREAVEAEIVDISRNAQKAPEEIYSCELNDRTLVVVRNGILVRIEKELIRHGVGPQLRQVKRVLEKSYMHNNTHLESILQKKIIDSFVDWDFDLDKSLIVFVLNPKLPRGGNALDMVDMS
ncbi:DUF2294 family protein [Paenibacillus antri]|uniref:DUF2294 family protein n=2 Tax=Paenibacillus antri TaxID=2582848 RepID=A0A5R9GCZ4_9BACL|nr:DUF2294 family protein [Paenibacillus antri]